MSSFIHYFIRHIKVTNWIMLVICLSGVFALFNLQKRINPKFELQEISIDVPYPGASPTEVEEGIVIKIEESLRGLEGISDVWARSTNNYGSVTVEVDDGYDMNKAIQNIKNAVNSINSYPVGAEKPVVYQETTWNRAIMISIYGPDDLFVTKKVVDEFRDELLKTGKVSNIRIWGLPDREISIEVSPTTLERYKLTVNDIALAIRNSNLNISSGSVLTEQEEILIRSYGRKYEQKEFYDIEVVSSIGGEKVRLADICDIREQWPENRFYSEFNGNRSVAFNVMYNNNDDVIEVVDIVEKVQQQFSEKYAGLVYFETFIKETDDLEERMRVLIQNGLIGLSLIVVLLGIFLNIRLAFWVSLGIPISFLGMFFVLWATGITINEMSLFGMILVVGILVDDAIIIGESIYAQAESGKPKLQAAIDGTLDVIKPVIIAVLTTIIAFIPYFYFYGQLGNFVWQIGAVVIFSLLFSLVEAIIILPAHIKHSKALDDARHKRKHNNPFFEMMRSGLNKFLITFFDKVYSRFLRFCLTNRWSVMAAMLAVLLIISGMFGGAHVRAQFFPEMEFPFARISIEMPAGASADVASDVRHHVIEKALEFGRLKEKEDGVNPIQRYTSWRGGNINIFLGLVPATERDWSVNDFMEELNEYIGSVPEADNVNIGTATFGGRPISVKLLSSDYSQLLKAKDLLKAELTKIDGIKDIQDDTPLGNNEFIIDLKPRAKALGFTLRDITTQLRQGFYGQEIMRLQKGRDELRVWVRFTKDDRVSISQIENLKILTAAGDYVPFKELADYRIERGLRQIRHENGYRSVRVYANFDHDKNNLAVVLEELGSEIVPRVLSQVDGVSKSAGGQQEYMEKMMGSITYSMSIAAVAIFTILMFLLKSYFQTLLIMSLIPLGVIGAVIGHYMKGIPVSILSFLGIVALAGIIINDSLVLIDRYNNLIRKGMDVRDAVWEAGKTRFRPIILTTITTAVGLAPLILQRSQQGQWLVPMALSVAAGLIFGTMITLLLLPSAIYCGSDIRSLLNRLGNKMFDKELKSRLELEPAFKASTNAQD
ncbi:MAG: efflux RND transporter permease subunit [Candidatus Marinimicrobia bacterium]|nr:efflux RND transporter permease subunit [Candidatus Neomarinimicrobiota bacterium]